ncbi:MAG TPA: DUF5715 family protein [Streptosporangiaceae bacterium]|nr:DUF5715 family protein [Streptosporangiaceae bacterium]
MTVWLTDRGAALGRPLTAGRAPREPDVAHFRAAVSELVAEFTEFGNKDAQSAEHMLARRLGENHFTAVLEATPDGRDETVARLLSEVRTYAPGPRSASSIAALIRISMLAQIDALWWGSDPGYATDADVLDAPELIDLDELAAAGKLKFSYRHQAGTLWLRAARSAERRALPGRSPRTAGIWLARTTPQAVAWLNQLADDFAMVAPADTPALWVTSLARSVEHQRRLRELGYVAPLPSAHCVGYAFDVEMAWYRRFHAHRWLRGLLLDLQRAGEVNVIDEGQAWHVCLRPAMVHGSRGHRRS